MPASPISVMSRAEPVSVTSRKCLVDRHQFLVAADDRRVEAPRRAVVPGRHGDETECRHALLLALQLERGHSLHLDSVAHQPPRGLADVDLVRRRRLLEARGDVDGVAGGELLVGGGVVVRHDLAGVDAGAVGELHAVRRAELLVDGAQRLAHARRGAHGSQRVVLVLHRQTEHRHDGVADVLLDLAAVARDLDGHGGEVAVLDLVQRLGIEPLAERRRVLQVAEDDGHRAAHLARWQGRRRSLGVQGRPAVTAKAELRRVLLVAVRTPDHGRQFRKR